MRAHPVFIRLVDSIFREPRPFVRYLLPILTLIVAVGIQLLISLFVPAKVDFPYVFLFLLAIFVTAWFGGYAPGAIRSEEHTSNSSHRIASRMPSSA